MATLGRVAPFCRFATFSPFQRGHLPRNKRRSGCMGGHTPIFGIASFTTIRRLTLTRLKLSFWQLCNNCNRLMNSFVTELLQASYLTCHWRNYIIQGESLYTIIFRIKKSQTVRLFFVTLKKFVKIPENTIFQENIGEIMWNGTKKSYAYCENADKTT